MEGRPPADGVSLRLRMAAAEDVVGTLIRVRLHTLSGAENQIIAVAGGQATVATNKPPEGKPVPINEVQRALDLLIKTGSIIPSPDSVGYRSAFIGAVLRTIPGVQADLTPGH